MDGWPRRIRACTGTLCLLTAFGTVPAEEDPDLIARGEYLARAGGCIVCHTDEHAENGLLAGGRAVKTPFGTFFSPNITPDRDTGIGGWSESDLARALHEGRAPDGSGYFPAFPYPAYRQLQSRDVAAIWAYLESVRPVRRQNRPHELPWYLRHRGVNRVWQTLFLKPPPAPDADRSETWRRGAYLARALAHCSECHTPRSRLGALDKQRPYAGTHAGPGGKPVPNITGDRKTGIGRWSEEDIAYYLETGMTPGGDYAGGLMAEVIDEGTRRLTKTDREALAHYVHSLRPIENAVNMRKERARGEFD